MTADQRNQRNAIKFWDESSKRDLATARDLLKLKHNHWSLFIYHLAIEKLLKALVIQAGITPPYTHNLERLAKLARLNIDKEQSVVLKEITEYNLTARYPGEKLLLYKKATALYTEQWSKNCEEIYQWLKQHAQ